jgi:hypothetical protein
MCHLPGSASSTARYAGTNNTVLLVSPSWVVTTQDGAAALPCQQALTARMCIHMLHSIVSLQSTYPVPRQHTAVACVVKMLWYTAPGVLASLGDTQPCTCKWLYRCGCCHHHSVQHWVMSNLSGRWLCP